MIIHNTNVNEEKMLILSFEKVAYGGRNNDLQLSEQYIKDVKPKHKTLTFGFSLIFFIGLTFAFGFLQF